MKTKIPQKIGLHRFIALGGKPEDYEGAMENAVEEAKEREIRNET